MRKILVWIISFLAIGISTTAQKNIKGTLSTTKLVNVEIMHVQPLNKKDVALVFRAETLEGEPAWSLKREEVIVKEDGNPCEILSLEPISKNRPISIALVIDHSGSMSFSWSLSDIINLIRGRKDSVISPLEYSKKSAKVFISSFNLKKDFIGVTGFGTYVDLEIPLTQNAIYLNKSIDSIQLDGTTALYDAMLAAMKQLKKAKGVKIVVALTDGMENASKSTWNDVVSYSTKNNIPVYSIGLGAVDIDTLTSLARETKGEFYHTNKSSSLVEIYKKISKQIQSFYSLEYRSVRLKIFRFLLLQIQCIFLTIQQIRMLKLILRRKNSKGNYIFLELFRYR
jgi:Ca-activated chloride channel family protein